MSDFSLLYKKYHTVSELTEALNNSVITLKRKLIASRPGIVNRTPDIGVTEKEVMEANQEITGILSALGDYYQKKDSKHNLNAIIDKKFLDNLVLNDVEFRSQVLETLRKTKAQEELSEADLLGVDKFISILDSKAAVLFRKLRTSRG